MDALSQYPPVRKNCYTHQPVPDYVVGPAKTPDDVAGRSCCCAAKAAVQVILPPRPGRPWETDLLMCGHHYRASCRALAAANATVHPLPGMPEDTAAWIGLELSVRTA